MAKQKLSTRKKKKKINLSFGKLYITARENNTIVTLTDENGNKVSGGGTGKAEFEGTKQSTPYAAKVLATQILQEAKNMFGLKEIGIVAKGVGLGRDGVFKAINEVGEIKIKYIEERTPIQFGGCRWTKPAN